MVSQSVEGKFNSKSFRQTRDLMLHMEIPVMRRYALLAGREEEEEEEIL